MRLEAPLSSGLSHWPNQAINSYLPHPFDERIVEFHNTSMTTANAKVREWSKRFRRDPLARNVVMGLRKRSADIWQRTFDLLQWESPEYRNSVDEEFTNESQSHCGELLNGLLPLLPGRRSK